MAATAFSSRLSRPRGSSMMGSAPPVTVGWQAVKRSANSFMRTLRTMVFDCGPSTVEQISHAKNLSFHDDAVCISRRCSGRARRNAQLLGRHTTEIAVTKHSVLRCGQAMTIIVILSFIATISILACHVYSALAGNVNAWPFSSYPMYSEDIKLEDVAIYRAQLEYPGGICKWWEPLHYKDKQVFAIRFARIVRNSQDSGTLILRADRLIRNFIVPDIISRGASSAGLPCQIRIMRRTAEFSLKHLKVSETIVYQVQLPPLRRRQ
jgi:hypothetical protein